MMQINERHIRFGIRSVLSLTLPVSLNRSIRMDVSGFSLRPGLPPKSAAPLTCINAAGRARA
ncbi:protein of unknown function [Azospirillum lipoferum 4B]|uniref:Uncharacterized protein n=1 Tax=Azospirillum lipoferum (strain 4B) TaxID=862719 RepID=G7Z7G1_AZOL4|nr:protein of unknown function [Azospirillum lipoferum 4B]